MAGRIKKSQTVPNPSEGGSNLGAQAPRKVLKAGPRAVDAWAQRIEESERLLEQQRQESERNAKVEGRRGLDQARAVAAAKGEEVTERQGGPIEVARDGLKWVRDKGTVAQPHYEAGLVFRADYELANGTGVRSCLADVGGAGAGAFGPKAGPTAQMLAARDRVAKALKALGTPELHGYVTLVAGEGVMLSDPRFSRDPRHVSHHHLPIRIALDLLARHYGMIR